MTFTTEQTELDWLSAVDHVDRVAVTGSRVAVEGTGPVLATVAAALVARGITPPDLRVEGATLEDVFLELTGEAGSLVR